MNETCRTCERFNSQDSLIDFDKTFQSPRSTEKCTDDKKWEIDVTSLLQLDIGKDKNGLERRGNLSCSSVKKKRLKTETFVNDDTFYTKQINMHGPLSIDQWLLDQESHVFNKHLWMHGWKWWYFCANALRLHNSTAKFTGNWIKIAKNCCLCQMSPRESGSYKSYQHSYSWPLILQGKNIHNICTRLSHQIQSVMLDLTYQKIHLQTRQFQIDYGANVVLFDTKKGYVGNVLHPLSWDVSDLGQTVLPNFAAG